MKPAEIRELKERQVLSLKNTPYRGFVRQITESYVSVQWKAQDRHGNYDVLSKSSPLWASLESNK